MYKYIKKNWKINIGIIILLLLEAGSYVSAITVNSMTLNSLVAKESGNFLFFISLSLGIWIFIIVIRKIKAIVIETATQNQVNLIRKEIISDITELEYEPFHDQEVSNYKSWLINDAQVIEQDGFNTLYSMIESLSYVLFSVLSLAFFNISFIVSTLIFSIIIISLPRFIGKRLEENVELVSTKNQEFTDAVDDQLNGFDVHLAYESKGLISNIINSSLIKLKNAKVDKIRAQSTVSMILFSAGVLAQVGTMGLTGFLILSNLVSVGAILSTGNLAGSIFNNLQRYAENIATFRATEKLFEKYQTLKKNDNTVHKNVNSNISEFSSEIHTKDLEVKYKNGRKVMIPNIHLEKGKKYAIVGKSGTGKSTLLKILSGSITRYSGDVFIDGINYKDKSLDSIRENICYIQQVPYLFNTTISDNVALGKNKTPEEIKDVLDKARLTDDYTQSMDGISYKVGKGGRNLSGGQQQRTAIARGLIRNKNFFLLDEVTSNLDEQTARYIENNLLQDKSLTILMVTHHLPNSSKEMFDEIYDIR